MTEHLRAEWFWVDRWSGSSAKALPLEARGLYREMLSEAWRRGARLPAEPEAIRRICGVTAEEWERSWPAVEPYWIRQADELVNETQLEVYGRSLAIGQARSEKSRKAARARWSRAARGPKSNARSNARAMPEQCPPDPDPDSSSSSSSSSSSVGPSGSEEEKKSSLRSLVAAAAPRRKRRPPSEPLAVVNGRPCTSEGQVLYETTAWAIERLSGEPYDRLDCGAGTFALIARQAKRLGPEELRNRIRCLFENEALPVRELLDRSGWTVRTVFASGILQRCKHALAAPESDAERRLRENLEDIDRVKGRNGNGRK